MSPKPCLWDAPLIKGHIGLIAGGSVSSPPISGFPLLQTAALTKVIHTIKEQCGNRKGWISWPKVGQFQRAILAPELAMGLATMLWQMHHSLTSPSFLSSSLLFPSMCAGPRLFLSINILPMKFHPRATFPGNAVCDPMRTGKKDFWQKYKINFACLA